jgi:hemerythrin superfamily protein
MDAIELLIMQHEDVSKLFTRLTESDSADTRRNLFARIADALAVHASIEEMHFYPAVKARRTEDILMESLEEHLAIKRLIADLLLMDTKDERFEAKVQVLKEQVEHHVEEEQTGLFPKVRRLFDADQLEAIGQLMTGTMVELEKGRPRFDVLGQTVAAAPLSGYDGTRGGHIASRLFPLVGRFVAIPLQLANRVRSFAQLARGVVQRRRERPA